MNTQTLRTGSMLSICLPLKAYKPVCRDRHKTVPEFILIPYDVDENHIGMFTDVKPAGKFCL